MLRYTKRTMKRHILQVHEDHRPRDQHVHKPSVIGYAFSEGDGLLDQRLGPLSPDERALASRAYDELRDDGLISPSYESPKDPDNWCRITKRGRFMLERSLLDELDEALAEIDPELIDLRDGAHDRARSTGSDAARQAAHSAQELMDQVLRRLVPDEPVRRQPWWEPVAHARSGVSRQQRVRLAVEQQGRGDWEAVWDVWNGAQLHRLRHRPGSTPGLSAEDAVRAAEIALKVLLLGMP